MLIDQFGRHINYLRLSLTDRCNYRCTYCMPEKMTFSPRSENLNLDELITVSRAFVELGVKKIRLTGGEPMIHPDFPDFLKALSTLQGLDQIAITTNGSFISQHIDTLSSSKVSQLNISLDSLNPETFGQITRQKPTAINDVLEGIDAAIEAGISRIRLNAVITKGVNEDDILSLTDFVAKKRINIAFIEEMPLGDMKHYNRSQSFVSSNEIKNIIKSQFSLKPFIRDSKQSGPATYYLLDGTTSEIGFISPHSNNFCHLCNRVRVTRNGKLILCLGNNDAIDLRQIIRASTTPMDDVKNTIINAMKHKPKSHEFDIKNDAVQVVRFMNTTGG